MSHGVFVLADEALKGCRADLFRVQTGENEHPGDSICDLFGVVSSCDPNSKVVNVASN